MEQLVVRFVFSVLGTKCCDCNYYLAAEVGSVWVLVARTMRPRKQGGRTRPMPVVERQRQHSLSEQPPVPTASRNPPHARKRT